MTTCLLSISFQTVAAFDTAHLGHNSGSFLVPQSQANIVLSCYMKPGFRLSVVCGQFTATATAVSGIQKVMHASFSEWGAQTSFVLRDALCFAADVHSEACGLKQVEGLLLLLLRLAGEERIKQPLSTTASLL